MPRDRSQSYIDFIGGDRRLHPIRSAAVWHPYLTRGRRTARASDVPRTAAKATGSAILSGYPLPVAKTHPITSKPASRARTHRDRP